MAKNEHDAAAEESVATAESEESEFTFVEPPSFQVDYKGDCAYEVKVTVPEANTGKKAEELFAELKDNAEVPGFRRGRAPIALLRKKFEKAVRTEAEAKLVTAAFQKLVKDEKLKPLGDLDIDGLEPERKSGEPLEFVLKFEVSPRVELGKYRGLEVERPVVTVDASDVKKYLEDLRARYAVFEALKTGKAKDGDQVIIDFVGRIDGEPFAGGSAESYPYILGTKRFYEEFENALAGAKAGDEITCKVPMPDNIPDKSIAGKEAEFSIKVNEVKRKKLPKLDDDFAKEACYDSLDAMQEAIKADLASGSKEQSERIAESRALDAVVAASQFEMPKSMIKGVAHSVFREEVQRMIQMRMDPEAIKARMTNLEEECEAEALTEIQRLCVLNEIGEAEGIEVTDEDFEKEVAQMAQRAGVHNDAVEQFLASDAEQRSNLASRIFRTKALAVILAHAKITDKEVPKEELDQEGADYADE